MPLLLAVAVGVASALAMIGRIAPEQTAASVAPEGWTQYRSVWVWKAVATTVEISVSNDGREWTRVGTWDAVTGTNTVTFLVPAATAATATDPRIRIGTADRRAGFEAAIQLKGAKCQ